MNNLFNWDNISLVLSFACLITLFSFIFYYIPVIGFILIGCFAIAASIVRISNFFD